MVGIHVSLLWCVSVVWTEGGTADFLVTVVTVVMYCGKTDTVRCFACLVRALLNALCN
jgi:hypothetical protein